MIVVDGVKLNDVEARVLLSQLKDRIWLRDYAVIYLKLEWGFNFSEIAEAFCLTRTRVQQLFKRGRERMIRRESYRLFHNRKSEWEMNNSGEWLDIEIF